MTKARQDRLAQPPPPKLEVIPPADTNGHRPTIEIGPATLNVFSQVLTQTDISKAQILTLLEAKGLVGEGNYRLVVLGAKLEPVD